MKIAYYTCFFGSDSNDRNCIPEAPAPRDSYYFTNNIATYNKLEGTQWNRVFVDIPIKNDLTLDAMDAKLLKACPYLFQELRSRETIVSRAVESKIPSRETIVSRAAFPPRETIVSRAAFPPVELRSRAVESKIPPEELKVYDATCYFDSALQVDAIQVQELCDRVFTLSNYSVIMARHPFLSPTWLPCVYNEYNNAMLQPRYVVQKDQIEAYMNEQVESGLLDTDCIHYATGFIVRKSNQVARQIGEVWYSHIKKCGIECQISFFFAQQMFKGHIYDIEFGSCFKRIGVC
jgi:hypothetical protein